MYILPVYNIIHVLMRDQEERSKQGQTNNKAKQHSTPKAVTFPEKNELAQVGLEPTTLCTLHPFLKPQMEHEKSHKRSH